MASSLSELREALTALGISTATGNLRGEDRRAELLRRLTETRDKQGEPQGRGHHATNTVEPASTGQTLLTRPTLEQWTLAELRLELDKRALPTLTPGLKGEARRHALIERVLNAHDGSSVENTADNFSSSRRPTGTVSSELADEPQAYNDVEDDTRSVASSSTAYSTTHEFLYFDLPATDRSDDRDSTAPVVPALQLPCSPSKLPLTGVQNAWGNADQDLDAVQNRLVECRDQLHTLRRERQRHVDKSLEHAGITPTLEVLSARLETLEGERRRLETDHCEQEFVSSSVLGSMSAFNSKQPLELVREDALRLIQAHQQSARQLIERTKQAILIVKTNGGNVGLTERSKTEEKQLEMEIRNLERQLQISTQRSTTATTTNRSNLFAQHESDPNVLGRCRSMPHNMFLNEWKRLSCEQRQQLHVELRSAASSHVKRDRICLTGPPAALTARAAPQSARQPSQADRLGIKARFLEQSKRSPLEIHRTYQAAVAADPSHAENLINYAAFLTRIGSQFGQAEQYLLRAIDSAPLHPKPLTSYANFLACVRGDSRRAAIYYDKALQLAVRAQPSWNPAHNDAIPTRL